MNKVLHNTPVFRMIGKYDLDKNRWIKQVDVVCTDVYKITINGHVRLICAFKKKSRWIPMDVLTGIALQGNFTTKTTALQAILEYFEKFLDLEFPHICINHIENLHRAEKDLFKALDKNQKVHYNRLVDLCEN